MRKAFLLFAALLCSTSFYGQAWDSSKPDKTLTFGVRAGANLSNINSDDDFNALWGFHGGLNIDINIVKSFAVETGVYYTSKGAKEVFYYNPFDNQKGTETERSSYIQLPVLALYRLPVSDDAHMQFKAGGYFSYRVGDGIGHKDTDAGAIVGAGISYSKFYFGLQYELGLLNMRSRYQTKACNRNLAISVGYDF